MALARRKLLKRGCPALPVSAFLTSGIFCRENETIKALLCNPLLNALMLHPAGHAVFK
jgi:hypothetical protein